MAEWTAPVGAAGMPRDNVTGAAKEIPAKEVWRKFVSYYQPFTLLFFADLACATLLAAIDLAFPQILNFFVRDFFVNAQDAIMDVLPVVAVALIGMYVVRSACQYFIATWGHIMGARMEANMRMDLFTQYQRLSFNYYDKNNTGEMMSKLVTDLFDISEVAHHGPENLFIATCKIVGSFVLLMLVNVPMTLIMLAATAIMAAYSVVANYRKRVIFRQNRQTMATLNGRIQDSLGGIRVVKGFGNEAIEIDRFHQANSTFIKTKELSYQFMGQFQMANSLFAGVLYTITIVAGGYFVAQGQMAASDLILYALYIGIFLAPIELLINFTETFQKGYAGFRRFVETLAEQPGVENAPNAVDFQPQHAPHVSYENVVFTYDGHNDVLNGITLDIPAGKTVALVGPSGGGKSTTCALLPRFYEASGGSIKVDDVDIRQVTLESLRSQVGIVQQDVYLFEGTVGENIRYGNPQASQEQIEWAAKQACLHDFVMGLPDGYDTLVGERGARLSGGQKQRVAIARVFLRDPRILILDEATSALDNESEKHVQESLERLSQDRTTLVIAHRLSTIRNADSIAVVDGGRVVEQGTHDQLMQTGGIYARYYRMQFPGQGK